MNKNILKLAIPNIITNITVPMLGMADIAIVGHLDNSTYIGALAVGTMIFNFIYWNFGFLRMGTTAFTAQAYGADNMEEAVRVLCRGICIALGIAFLLITLQYPIAQISMYLIDSSTGIKTAALQYFFIRIWAAPATLGLYALKGWFIGMQNARVPMFIAILMNVVNIILGLFFVFVCKMDVAGVALGTVLAQYFGLICAVAFWFKNYRQYGKYFSLKKSMAWSKMSSFFKVNRDIFLRSLCLTCVFSFFPIAGAKISDTILNVNTLLMQFFMIFSYIMDGFAHAAEALTGKYIGAKDKISLKKMLRLLFTWGGGLSICFSILYAFCGKNMLFLFTDKTDLITAAQDYYYWVLLVPLTGFTAFLWDGVYLGATASKTLLLTMLIATIIFFGTYFGLHGWWGNNALWIAMILFLFSRGILQTLLAKKSVLLPLNILK
ncbi:MAG: MATE family efflux transporter [Bacteroidales bacterium]|jgi:MATE family multidrug resistance protein|nr:MATE family efflux transporter [Bacteroidales bacterium]